MIVDESSLLMMVVMVMDGVHVLMDGVGQTDTCAYACACRYVMMDLAEHLVADGAPLRQLLPPPAGPGDLRLLLAGLPQGILSEVSKAWCSTARAVGDGGKLSIHKLGWGLMTCLKIVPAYLTPRSAPLPSASALPHGPPPCPCPLPLLLTHPPPDLTPHPPAP